MLFALSCSGIWIGLFDSIQEICKERVIVKREYMANLKLPGYIMSKFTLQAILGFVQALILTALFLGLVGKEREGLFLDNFQIEMFLTVWLTVLASITMGFVISAVVKSGDKAMAVAPFVLIVQLLFSGILFTLEGIGEKISYCTVSRWSVEAMGSISNLNDLELRLQQDYPMLEHEAEAFFEATRGHLVQTWGILLGMVVLFTVVSIFALRRIAKDTR
jgi:ABC-type transport system involved in multi-copper enzyme maturation permease subunit